jgi:hypothetical protein
VRAVYRERHQEYHIHACVRRYGCRLHVLVAEVSRFCKHELGCLIKPYLVSPTQLT